MSIANDQMQWQAFSLTTVLYPKHDAYGKFLAVCSLLPIAIVVAFFTLSLFVRDIHVVLFFAGQILNELLNFLLKNWAQDPRPKNSIRDQLDATVSYGWPSSHCQFIAFFGVYSTLCILNRLSKIKPRWFCFWLILLNAISVIFIFHSRIYLLYHYIHQCIHGLIIGSIFALVWYIYVQYVFEPLFYRYILSSSLNQFFGFCSIYLPLKPKQY